MDIDDIVIGEPKTDPETLRHRLERLERSTDMAQILALAAIALVLIIGSRLS